MRLAFYAPMKPPDHPVPSGDRSIAQALVTAFKGLGYEVELASRLQTRDGKGSRAAQAALQKAATAEVDTLCQKGAQRGWRCWVTYHNYYKAPDLIGPRVAEHLGIPYVQIESTRARKRLSGDWAAFAELAEQATDAARVVFYFSQRDAEALRRDAPNGQELLHLRPFLPRVPSPLTVRTAGPILSVGMMRRGDKLSSYQLVTETLALLQDQNWTLEIVGDGPARADIEDLMHRFGKRVRFLGRLEGTELQDAYRRAGVFFWPGVNEALGMVYLEAQAAGLPVVAQDRPGMRDVLAPGAYPAVEDGPEGLAAMLARYLAEPEVRQSAGAAAYAHVSENHMLTGASRTLAEGLTRAGISA